MRDFELTTITAVSAPRVDIQKLGPAYPQIRLASDLEQYKHFNADRFCTVRDGVREELLKHTQPNSWYHRRFFISNAACADVVEVLVDKDLTRDLGVEFYLSHTMFHSTAGASPGSARPMEFTECWEVFQNVFKKASKVTTHPVIKITEHLLSKQVRMLGKDTKFRAANGEISAMCTYFEDLGGNENMSSLLGIKIKAVR